jgi:hypothetical protein
VSLEIIRKPSIKPSSESTSIFVPEIPLRLRRRHRTQGLPPRG